MRKVSMKLRSINKCIDMRISSSDNTTDDIENTSDCLLYLDFDGNIMLYYLHDENKQYYTVEIKK